MVRLKLLVFMLVGFFVPLFVRADEPVTIERVERWSNVFADSETRWTYRISCDKPFRERVVWRLTVNQRTLASGELEARGAPNKPSEVTIPLRWPTAKAGTVLTAQLSLSVGDDRHEQTVSVFPRDSFAGRSSWLESLKLKVFDTSGETLSLLKENDVPHEQLRTRDALDEVTDGIVIVGEGVSLKKHNGLIDDLRTLAARGVAVLCLASADGDFHFLREKPLAMSVQLRRAEVIGDLDKRLDTAWWPKGPSQQKGLRIASSSEDVISEISDDARAWSWCEWQFDRESNMSSKPSRLIWCGFGIVRSWDDGPTPRYLLTSILERLSDTVVERAARVQVR